MAQILRSRQAAFEQNFAGSRAGFAWIEAFTLRICALITCGVD